MFKKVALILGIVVVAFVAVVATRPDTFKIERSAVVTAPPAIAFAQVNDFHAWAAWSPWEKLDPSMKKTYDGAPMGTGATYYWIGNDKVGEGRMTITDSKPGERVVIKLEFLKPWQATNLTTFTFAPSGKDATQVTWMMEGTHNFAMKAFAMFMNMDSMVGKDFEKGLAQLKSTAEGEEQKRAAAEAASRLAAEAAAAAAPPPAPAAAEAVAAPAEPTAAGVTH